MPMILNMMQWFSFEKFQCKRLHKFRACKTQGLEYPKPTKDRNGGAGPLAPGPAWCGQNHAGRNGRGGRRARRELRAPICVYNVGPPTDINCYIYVVSAKGSQTTGRNDESSLFARACEGCRSKERTLAGDWLVLFLLPDASGYQASRTHRSGKLGNESMSTRNSKTCSQAKRVHRTWCSDPRGFRRVPEEMR